MIYEQIKEDIKVAMKAQKTITLQTLRTIDSNVQKTAIDTKQPISDAMVADVLQKGIKQRQDSIEMFLKGNRNDLVSVEEVELILYRQYLPKQLSEEEITAIIQKAASEVVGQMNIGALMKMVVPLTKGKADGKLVNKLVQEFVNH